MARIDAAQQQPGLFTAFNKIGIFLSTQNWAFRANPLHLS
jgi:hypothetical protein